MDACCCYTRPTKFEVQFFLNVLMENQTSKGYTSVMSKSTMGSKAMSFPSKKKKKEIEKFQLFVYKTRFDEKDVHFVCVFHADYCVKKYFSF